MTDDVVPLGAAALIAGQRCRVLWLSVLLLAMQDAARGDHRAQAWLHTSSCRWICAAIGIPFDWVRNYDLSRLSARRRSLNTSLVMGRRANPAPVSSTP